MDGRACRAWAVRDSDSPLCATHGGRPAGFADDVVPQHSESNAPDAFAAASAVEQDRSAPDLEEVALLVNLALDDGLEDEVAASRVAVQRVMEELREELSPAEFARLAGLVFRGSDTIARLLRAQRELSGDAADGLAGAISEALDGLGDEWGLEL
jgi:soluble lytic murein transglycosylase-like protein